MLGKEFLSRTKFFNPYIFSTLFQTTNSAVRLHNLTLKYQKIIPLGYKDGSENENLSIMAV